MAVYVSICEHNISLSLHSRKSEGIRTDSALLKTEIPAGAASSCAFLSGCVRRDNLQKNSDLKKWRNFAAEPPEPQQENRKKKCTRRIGVQKKSKGVQYQFIQYHRSCGRATILHLTTYCSLKSSFNTPQEAPPQQGVAGLLGSQSQDLPDENHTS